MKHQIFRLTATLVAAAAIGAPGGAQAQTLTELRPTFMEGCIESGNDAPICGCIFDNWSVDVPEEKYPLAEAAITMFSGEMPTNAQDMMAATALLQDMTSVLMQCASGALEVSSASGKEPIPQTGDEIEEQLLFERVTAGGTPEEMARYAALVEARKAAERAGDIAAQQAQDDRAKSNRTALKAAYEEELARIHSREITAWRVADFAPLFDLYCRSGGGTAPSCTCAWPILAELSTSNAVPYMASRDEGDDIRQRLSLADISAAPFALGLFNERRAICDE